MYIWLNLLFMPFLKRALGDSIPILQPGQSLSIAQSTEWNSFQLNLSSPSQEYIRVSIQVLQKPDTSEPVLTMGEEDPSFSSDGSSVAAEMVDYDGWFSQCGYHSLIFQSSSISSSSNIYIAIGNFNYLKGQITYIISIDEDDDIICPQDCNSRGICVSLGVCDCQNGYIGVGCENEATEITQNNLYSLNAPCQGVHYAYINRQKVSNDALKFNFGWTKSSSRIFFDFKGRGIAELPSPRSFFYQVLLPAYDSKLKVDFDVTKMSDMIYIALYNDLNCTSGNFNLYVKLAGGSSKKTDIGIYVWPTIAVILFIICVIVGVMYYRHWRQKRQSLGLSLANINRKFPVVHYSKVSSKLAEKNCAICMEEFQEKSLVRRLTCDHIYHDHCIKHWFKISKFCYICKQDCRVSPEESIDLTMDKEVLSQSNTITTVKDELSISGVIKLES